MAGAHDSYAFAVKLAEHVETVRDKATHQHQHHRDPAVGDDPSNVIAGVGDLDVVPVGCGELLVLFEVHHHALDEFLAGKEWLPLPGSASRFG